MLTPGAKAPSFSHALTRPLRAALPRLMPAFGFATTSEAKAAVPFMLLDRSAKSAAPPKILSLHLARFSCVAFQASLRDATLCLPSYPALKRWATIGRPCGTIFASAGTTAILPDKIGDNSPLVC
jgi:hypothetical protein